VRRFFDNFSRRVLQISNGIENVDGIVTHLTVALAVAWIICFLALSKGVQSLGKVKLIISERQKKKQTLILFIKIDRLFYCFISLCNVNCFNRSWSNIKWCC
jgi:hypothetical protein